MSIMGSTYGHDWPLELAGAHGRISAYRATLAEAKWALRHARPFVTDDGVRARVNSVLLSIEAELAIHTVPPRSES